MSNGEDIGSDPADQNEVNEIGRKSRRGLTWSLFGNLITKLGTFAVGLVMARLLSPADFGVYAAALAAMGIAMYINDAGTFAACVQWRGKLEDMAPTASTIALVSSLVIYALVWAGAPAYATVAGVPEASPVVRLLALVIVVDGVAAVRAAALNRRFEQDRLIKANVMGTLANAAVALPLGVNGAGAYSLASAQLIGWIVTSVIVFKMGDLPVRLGFDKAIANKLLRFGLPLSASLGIEAVLLNADFIIIGNVLGAAWLGYYLLAYNISNWVPGIVGTAVRYVSISGFSRLAEQGHAALVAGVRQVVPVMVSAILPAAVVMATLAPQLVDALYGDKWGPSAVALRYLAVLMVVRMLTSLAIDILTSMGATKSAVWLNAGWAAALVPALWVGTQLDGIRGAAIAHGLVASAVALPLAVLALRLRDIRLGPTLPALIRPLLAAATATAAIVVIQPFVGANAFVQLVAAGGTAMIIYVLIVVPREQFRRMKARVLSRREAESPS